MQVRQPLELIIEQVLIIVVADPWLIVIPLLLYIR